MTSTQAAFDRGSRSRLTRYDLHRFGGRTLFDRVARVVCEVGHLPRKELFESWEVARRVRRRMRGGRVVDLACGHGLVAHLMLLLDDSSSDARGIDAAVPPGAAALSAALTAAWPRIAGRVTVDAGTIEQVRVGPEDLVVAVHACGGLTDRVLDHAIAARARVAVMACCHDAAENDQGAVGAWLAPGLAIDVTRVARLRHSGYEVRTQTVPADITPENRLILATPRESVDAALDDARL